MIQQYLGDGSYTASFQDRNGAIIHNPSDYEITVRRKLDDVSSGDFTITPCQVACRLTPWATQLRVGLNGNNIWSGVITEYDPDSGTGKVADRSIYWFHQLVKSTQTITATDASLIFEMLLTEMYSSLNSPPGLGFTTPVTTSGVLTERSWVTDQQTYGELLQGLGQTAVDWTVVGDKLYCGGVTVPVGLFQSLSTATKGDWAETPKVLQAGDVNTRVVVVGANNLVGAYPAAVVIDPRFGVLEKKVTGSKGTTVPELQLEAMGLYLRTKDGAWQLNFNGTPMSAESTFTVPKQIPGRVVNIQIGHLECPPFILGTRLTDVELSIVGVEGKGTWEGSSIGVQLEGL